MVNRHYIQIASYLTGTKQILGLLVSRNSHTKYDNMLRNSLSCIIASDGKGGVELLICSEGLQLNQIFCSNDAEDVCKNLDKMIVDADVPALLKLKKKIIAAQDAKGPLQ